MALKSLLITGCSFGSSAFQERNMHVFATAPDPGAMSHFENSPNITLLSFDPTSAPSIGSVIRLVEA